MICYRLLKVPERCFANARDLEAITKQYKGEESPDLLQVLDDYSQICIEFTQPNEAMNVFRRYLAVTEKVHGKQSEMYIQVLEKFGNLQLLCKQSIEAYQTLIQALELSAELFGKESLPCAKIITQVGLAQHQMDRNKEALQSMQKSIDMIKKIGGPRHPDIQQAKFWAGKINEELENQKKKERQERWQRIAPNTPKKALIYMAVAAAISLMVFKAITKKNQ